MDVYLLLNDATQAYNICTYVTYLETNHKYNNTTIPDSCFEI